MDTGTDKTSPPPILPCRVLIVDHDPDVRAALRLLLARQPDFRVLGTCRSVDELLRESATCKPDLILLDWEAPGLHADRQSPLVVAAAAIARTVVLSTRDEQRASALETGASGFVCKSESPSRLLETLREVQRLSLRQ